jgi:hypothetical protein
VRLRDAFDTVLSILVVAAAAAVIYHHGRLSVFHFEGLSIPLWALMALCLFWPICSLIRLFRGRSPSSAR